MSKPAKHKWTFRARFRAGAFGWRSQPAITRIKEAVSEIKKTARKDPVLGAEGAVLFLEKVSSALERIDSSSGAIGSAVYHAINTLVPIIVNAPAEDKVRDKWLDQLWVAFNEDQIPYIEQLADWWGELCVTPERASLWADDLIHPLLISWTDQRIRSYFQGTSACLSSLLAAKRYRELLDLIEKAPIVWWHYRRFGSLALAAMGKADEALEYAEKSVGRNDSPMAMTRACEEILLEAGRVNEAYDRYAIISNERSTRLNTFRAIAGKYPLKDKAEILMDLIDSTPGSEGKWFATAKNLKQYELAGKLANLSPCEPQTLNRAARDYMTENPEFALESATASLRWISEGWGYEITALDIRSAFDYAMEAASKLDRTNEAVERIRSFAKNRDSPKDCDSPGEYARQTIRRLLETVEK